MMAASMERQKTTRRREIGEARIRVRLTARNWMFIDQKAKAYLAAGGVDPAFAFLPELRNVIAQKTAKIFDDVVQIEIEGPFALWGGLILFLEQQARAYGLCQFLSRGLSRAREKIERTLERRRVDTEASSDAEAGFGGEVGD